MAKTSQNLSTGNLESETFCLWIPSPFDLLMKALFIYFLNLNDFQEVPTLMYKMKCLSTHQQRADWISCAAFNTDFYCTTAVESTFTKCQKSQCPFTSTSFSEELKLCWFIAVTLPTDAISCCDCWWWRSDWVNNKQPLAAFSSRLFIIVYIINLLEPCDCGKD